MRAKTTFSPQNLWQYMTNLGFERRQLQRRKTDLKLSYVSFDTILKITDHSIIISNITFDKRVIFVAWWENEQRVDAGECSSRSVRPIGDKNFILEFFLKIISSKGLKRHYLRFIKRTSKPILARSARTRSQTHSLYPRESVTQ